mgnify:CR=1 FL=1|jgi:hypothetical protein
MPRFTSGKYAFGMCDICGDKEKYLNLRKQWDGMMACPVCFDTKHPQDFPKRFNVIDPESIKDSRSDNDDSDSSIYSEVDNQWEVDNP